MDYNKLASLLFPEVSETVEDLEKKFPKRELPEGANITRIGPSPTGFVHLGNLYNAIIGERLAHQSNGTFYLRIEDTDNKREVEGAVNTIITSMDYFGIHFDEGATADGDNGAYGPYRQRQRKEIYHIVAKKLVEMGFAYPCFCSEDELNVMREKQIADKVDYGYYGEWAKCRNLDFETIKSRIEAGDPYVLRFRSQGNSKNYINVFDGIRGDLRVQENYQDFVLLKSDGIPTYHFAHAVDDHLMQTTHVVRGEEWLATLPIHAQLFDTLGFKRPIYCHTATLMKMDGESKRKLSKRHDPELALAYYREEGYIPKAVWEYLLTVLNSNFEEWRIANPEAPISKFQFTLKKMSSSGALFDLAKFNDISKDVLSKLPAEEIYAGLTEWAQEYDEEFYNLLTKDKGYTLKALSIGRGVPKPRKDLVSFKQAKDFLSFYYNETFKIEDEYPERVDSETRKVLIEKYVETLDFNDDQETWFGKMRDIGESLGYAGKPKDFKKNPEAYKGSIVDISGVLRVAITGRQNAPDLWEVSQILGKETVLNRLNNVK